MDGASSSLLKSLLPKGLKYNIYVTKNLVICLPRKLPLGLQLVFRREGQSDSKTTKSSEQAS